MLQPKPRSPHEPKAHEKPTATKTATGIKTPPQVMSDVFSIYY
jgi:hypothetical protein